MPSLKAQVAVIGIGAMGSASLWQLAERGVSVVGFEQFEPGHDRGSSHGETRIYRTAYLEGPGYVPLARRAVELWRQLQDVTGVELLTENGALMLGLRDSSVITATMRSIRAHDLQHELLDEVQLRSRYPGHRIAPGEVAIHENDAGFVRPERAIRTAVARALDLGARLVTNKCIDSIELGPDGVRVIAGDVVCEAHHAIVSVGSWLGTFLPELKLPLRVTRQLPGWYPVERPELFTPDRFPVFLRDLGDRADPSDVIAADSTFYGFPTLDGKTIKVAVHREGPLTEPDALDRTVTRDDLAEVRGYIQAFLNGVSSEPVRTEVCMYTNTPDHDFLVGSPPGMHQITVLGGFSGHGFKFSPVMGEVAADFAMNGGTDHPVGFLSPDRFLRKPHPTHE